MEIKLSKRHIAALCKTYGHCEGDETDFALKQIIGFIEETANNLDMQNALLATREEVLKRISGEEKVMAIASEALQAEILQEK